jgi:alanine dehydrogenase
MVRYLTYEDTIRLDLRMKDLVPVLEEVYRRVGEGQAATHHRVHLVHPPVTEGAPAGRPWTRDLRILPAMVPGVGAACRLGATSRGLGSGVLMAYWDFETLQLRAIISDALVHSACSATPNGVLAKHLARPDAAVLGVLGSGKIARWAAEAVWSQRPIRTIKVYSPTPAHRAAFCDYVGGRVDAEMVDCASSDEVVAGSDVVVMACNTREPVLNGELIAPGCTVISHASEELDHASLRRAHCIVGTSADEVAHYSPPWQALTEMIARGELPPDAGSLEIADIILGRQPGRTSDDEIIVCLTPGSGMNHVAVGYVVYQRALALGIGTDLPT